MAIKRVVDTSFWTDSKVVEEFSPEDRYFMLYLLTNPHTTQLGIYELNKRQCAFELGYSTESVSVLIDRFDTKYNIIRYSQRTKEVAIKNFLVYSIIKGGKPVEDLLEKEIKQVKDKSLLTYIFGNIYNKQNLNETVKKIIDKYVNDKDNVNDNDNDVSYHDSYDDSSISKKSVKHKHGEYGRVLLTDKEYEKLVADFGADKIEQQITLLDEYVESNNNKNKYTNFNLVLRKSINNGWFDKTRKPTTEYDVYDEF